MMKIWNANLTVKEKVDKAIKNQIKAEEEIKALIEWAKQQGYKSTTKENIDNAIKSDIYDKQYRNECYRKALIGFGISKEEAELNTNHELDIFDEDIEENK